MRSNVIQVAVLGLFACAPATEEPRVVPPEVAEIGAEAARSLRTGLVQRLTAALEGEGPVAAIDVCAVEAIPLTDSIARAVGSGIAIRRVSRRVRNPANAPDATDVAALEHFESAIAAGESAPSSHVVEGADGFRYYEPLFVMPPCLRCHGPSEALDPGVRAAIAERYPEDRAAGYAEGDLRGLIRVTIPTAGR